MKRCSTCKQVKGARQFRQHGLVCRRCRALTTQWRQTHKLHCNKYSRKYRQTHPFLREYQRQYNQQYYQKHKADWDQYRPRYPFVCQWCRKQTTSSKSNCKYCSLTCMGQSYKHAGTNSYKHKGKTWEHRVAMTKIIGRPLAKGEVVHHINGNQNDNHPSNLMLFPSASMHVKHHWELARQRIEERKSSFSATQESEIRSNFQKTQSLQK